MSLENARHQKPEPSGRSGRRRGEAESETERDEAGSARRDREGSGRDDLLKQALARENVVLAWKRVQANRAVRGYAGTRDTDGDGSADPASTAASSAIAY